MAKPKTLITVVAVATVLAGNAQYQGARPVPQATRVGFESIHLEDAKAILGFLAGPDFLGRAPDQPGFAAAAGFCADWFRQCGLQPAGDNGSYFQRFTMQQVSVIAETASLSSSDGAVRLAWGQDFACGAQADVNTMFRVALVTLPAGGVLPPSDVAKLRGCIAIMRPGNDRTAQNALTQLQFLGTLGALQIVTPDTSNRPLTGFNQTVIKDIAQPEPTPFTFLRITAGGAKRMAEKGGAANYLSEKPTTASIEFCPTEYVLSAKTSSVDQFTTLNVIAKLEGTDPTLKSEAVVIGSHLDHLGSQASGVRYGADDNASGCTANMLIARALTLNATKPKRTVVFALWSMEERGLQGSYVYTVKPVVPIKDTIAYINMDMVGRNADYRPWNELAENNTDSVYLGIAKLNSPDLYNILTDTNRYLNLRLRDDKEDRTMRSDTGNFVKAGVPTVKAFTGEHPDYHRTGDTPDKINYEKLVAISKWLYLSTFELANIAVRPRFEKGAKYLTGSVRYEEKIVLTRDAVVEVFLADVTKAGAPATILDKTIITRPGQVPVRFTLRYNPRSLNPDAVYVVQAKITDGDSEFAMLPFRVLTGGWPLDNLDIVLKKMR